MKKGSAAGGTTRRSKEQEYEAVRDNAFNTGDDAEYHNLIGDDAKYLELIGDQAKDQVPQDWLEKLLSHLDWYGKDNDDEEDPEYDNLHEGIYQVGDQFQGGATDDASYHELVTSRDNKDNGN